MTKIFKEPSDEECENLLNQVLSWNPEKNTVAELKAICDKIGINTPKLDLSVDRIGAFGLYEVPLASEYEQSIVSFIDDTDFEWLWAVDFEGNCLVGIPQKIVSISELVRGMQ